MSERKNVFHRLLLLFVCLILSSCLVQTDSTGLKQSITSDARIAGQWSVQKWGDDNLSCTGCRDITIEEQQYQDQPVYKVSSPNDNFTKDIMKFVTLYHFNEAYFLYTGFPTECDSCNLLKYEMVGDTLTISVLKDNDAAKVLQGLHPTKNKIFYEDNPTSDVRVDLWDEESKRLLAALAQKNELWTEFIIMKKL